MANIKKGARAYYADTDYKRDGTIEAYDKIDNIPAIPTPTSENAGQVIKVDDNGDYALLDDLHTPVIANPDTESTERLDKLTVGNTTYLVNEDVMPTVIKAVRLKINTIHGSDQNVAIRRLRMKNTMNGDYYQFGGSDTCTCSTETNVSNLINNGTFDETYIPASELPFSIDINFADSIDLTQFNEFGMICAPYENASPLSVDIDISADGEHFINVGSNNNVTFSYTAYVPFYKFGDVELRIPDYTSANRGDVLSIDNTDHVVWGDVPSDVVIVNVSGDTITDNITIAEINTLVNSGKLVVLNAAEDGFYLPSGIGRATDATNTDCIIFTRSRILYLTDHYSFNVRTLSKKRSNTGKVFDLKQTNIDITV